MITLIYRTKIEDKNIELEWLREQKIFPAFQEAYDMMTQKTFAQFGIIVSPEQALAVKLRHKLDIQKDYRQR